MCRDGVKDSSTSGSSNAVASHAAYLKQKLVYTPEGDKLLDADGEDLLAAAAAAVKHAMHRTLAWHGMAWRALLQCCGSVTTVAGHSKA